jgi:transcriptional regulator with XRE-family HTH domain
MTEIKDRIKLLRINLKLRQQDMAAVLMIPFTAISKYEQGKIKPSSEILAKMAKIYNVNLNWLLTGVGSMFAKTELVSATGTFGLPHLRLIKTNSNIIVENFAETEVSDNDIENLSLSNTLMSDEPLIKLAKKIKKPLTIEYFENGTKTDVKIFHPDGSIKPSLSVVESENIYIQKLKQKIEKLSDSKEKLEFIELAINSFEDNEAFDKLILLIKGMALVKNK